MINSQAKPIVFSGKMVALAILACFVTAGAVPSQVLAKTSPSDCSQSPYDEHIGLYFRQNQLKQAKKYTLKNVGKATLKTATEPLFAPKAKPLTYTGLFDKVTKAMGKKPVVKKVAIAGEAPIAPDRLVRAVITAYTSTPDQTDSTPDIAASGKHVYDGMIAANWLPFGTKVKIPALYGDKIFTVDDRMNKRYGYGRMDVWLNTSKAEARKFGVRRVEVQVFYPEDRELALNR